MFALISLGSRRIRIARRATQIIRDYIPVQVSFYYAQKQDVTALLGVSVLTQGINLNW